MKILKSLSKWFAFLWIIAIIFFQIAAKIESKFLSEQSIIERRIDYKIYRAAKKYGNLKLGLKGSLNDIMLDKIRDKTYSFQSLEDLTLNSEREYLVKLTLDILKIYNEENAYRKYLFEYPFQIKNLKLSIISSSGSEKDQTLPNLMSADLILTHVVLEYLANTSNQSPIDRDLYGPGFEKRKIKEGFRIALNRVKNSLSPEQIDTAKGLGLLDDNVIDEETSADREYMSEIDSKELWVLHYEKRLREGTISQEKFYRDLRQIKKGNSTQWEKDIIFPDEKSKALYQKKVEYLKGEKEWEN